MFFIHNWLIAERGTQLESWGIDMNNKPKYPFFSPYTIGCYLAGWGGCIAIFNLYSYIQTNFLGYLQTQMENTPVQVLSGLVLAGVAVMILGCLEAVRKMIDKLADMLTGKKETLEAATVQNEEEQTDKEADEKDDELIQEQTAQNDLSDQTGMETTEANDDNAVKDIENEKDSAAEVVESKDEISADMPADNRRFK